MASPHFRANIASLRNAVEQHHFCEANASYCRKAMHHLTGKKFYDIIISPKIKNLTNGDFKVKRQSRKLSSKQLALVLIPFVSTICCLVYFLFTKRYYTKKCLFSLLKACLATFVSGVVLMFVGLFSYTVTAVISLVLMGIVMNFVFFKSYSNTVGQ